MIKTILVPATGSDGEDRVFASAAAVARGFGAHIDFLHVRVDALAAAAAMPADTAGGALVSGLVDRIEIEAEERQVVAQQRVTRFCEREKLAIGDEAAAAWLVATGDEPDRVAEYARTADLVVIGRPGEADGIQRETLEAVLVESGRPLLLPGAATLAGLPETVAIAWKPTREAAHAVVAAMPFLASAKQIVILTVAEDDGADDGAERLMTALRRHQPAVTLRRFEAGADGAAAALLAAAREHRALLAMGGYSRSPMREWIFGGVTQRILAEADMPVLIAH